jgi:hypothetical protein
MSVGMLEVAISWLIILGCSGFLAYWLSRAVILVYGSDDDIIKMLSADSWWFGKLLFGSTLSLLHRTNSPHD